MATNDFKPFATGAGANVTSQSDWEGLPALLSGFTSGKASSSQVNKAIRQASFIAAALAQFVTEKTDSDVHDDGDLAGFVSKLTAGFAAQYLSRSNPFGDIKSDGETAISTALANLGLGDQTGYVGRLLNVQFFETSGTYIPTNGTKKIIVEAIGGGGASGGVGGTDPLKVSMSGCGTNGAYAKALFANVSATYITIGAGGAGVINSRGNDGGTTSFGSYLTCPGGGGAPAGQSNIDPSLIYNSATNATEAPQPTVNNGIMIKTMTPSPTVSCCVSLGYGSALLCYPPFTHIGRHYGAGGNSVYITQNTPAQPGFSGGDGKVIIWEYA
ncbi:hypothetical protein [Leminorella grimontii]|uniref:glycine-rich domain-containing protein n=1 Tax=Leminorella grimontii TaxID=82981 RepID=UPI003BB8AE4F